MGGGDNKAITLAASKQAQWRGGGSKQREGADGGPMAARSEESPAARGSGCLPGEARRATERQPAGGASSRRSREPAAAAAAAAAARATRRSSTSRRTARRARRRLRPHQHEQQQDEHEQQHQQQRSRGSVSAHRSERRWRRGSRNRDLPATISQAMAFMAWHGVFQSRPCANSIPTCIQ